MVATRPGLRPCIDKLVDKHVGQDRSYGAKTILGASTILVRASNGPALKRYALNVRPKAFHILLLV
jgi:hypothetical protein